MDKDLERALKKKIMAGEELTEEEKKYFVNYDEWKAAHDAAHAATVEGLRWNAWPVLFVCAFFLVSNAVQNIRIISALGGAAGSSLYTQMVISIVLGAASVIGSFYMKHRANEIHRKQSEVGALIVTEETEEAEETEYEETEYEENEN